MIVTVDLKQLAGLALAEGRRHPPRSSQRRAASHLWAALEYPGGTTISAVRRAIASFGDERTQAAALELLHRLAAQTSVATAAAAPTGRKPA